MSILIKCGNLIDGTGGSPRENMNVLVENSRIAAIVPHGVREPKADVVIDAMGRTVLPGLIDAHVHPCFDPAPTGYRSRDESGREVQLIRGVKNMRAMLEGGITTVRSLGTMDDLDFYLRDAIRDGAILGPRIIAAGRGISITGGHGHYISMEADGPEEIRKAVRTAVRNGADVIKLFATGGIMTSAGYPGAPQLGFDEIDIAIREAHKAGLKVTTHAEGREGVNNVLRAGIDCIEHGYFMNNEEGLDMLVKSGTYLVPTIMAYDLIANADDDGVPQDAISRAKSALEYNTVGFRNALAAGAKIAMGSDAGTPFNDHARSWRELVYMVKNGMAPMHAIISATRNGADLLGVGDKVGTLETGMIADLIVIDGDPLSDISQIGNVDVVIKEGRVVPTRLGSDR